MLERLSIKQLILGLFLFILPALILSVFILPLTLAIGDITAYRASLAWV